MNAKRSWFFYILAVVITAGIVWGFAHGAQLLGDDDLKGIAWIGGALVAAVLGVRISYKTKRK